MKLEFVVLLLLVGTTVGQEFKRGRIVSTRRSGRAIKTPAEICVTDENVTKTYCNGADALGCDSTGLVQCSGIGRGALYECYGDTPFCQADLPGEATCTADRPAGCEPSPDEISQFECLEEGFFPDVYNCHKYYQCYDNGTEIVADELECDNYYVFDPSAPNNDYCRLTLNRYCVQITENTCAGTVNSVLLNYPFFPRAKGEYVATCRNNKAPIITFCRAGFHADLKTLPVKCLLTCTRPNKSEYPGDETRYYDCVYNGKIYEGKVKSCYRNYYFNPRTQFCEYRAPTTAAPTGVQ